LTYITFKQVPCHKLGLLDQLLSLLAAITEWIKLRL
jgi:hypothetical protein